MTCTLTISRRGRIVGQEHVTALAIAFVRADAVDPTGVKRRAARNQTQKKLSEV
jgi:hypothetical protein